MVPETSAERLVMIYNLTDDSAWERARIHRDLWGRLCTDIYPIDTDHVILVFRSKGERWRAWEKVRLQMILETVAHHQPGGLS